MKPSIIHSIVVCLAAFTLPFMVACSSREESLPDNVTEAALYLNIATIEQTRANTVELPDNEKMKSVRVVILHAADGTVEHNRHFSLEGAQAQKTHQTSMSLPRYPSESFSWRRASYKI